MHELHLMRQVVKTVEAGLSEEGDAKLSVVRLKVSALSHLLTQDHATLQATFQLAARGTKAEGVRLEVIPVPADAWCPECKSGMTVTELNDTCSACEGSVIATSGQPEVVLHELVVQG
ncbi:putative Hydrogenase nickel incorporation protein HypA [Candidatus Nitrospira nitrosa]|uniref:Putative Hydrogenase nickel incorporation protein HypA n=1 Tax=Candidatus Nitrospira nitrosa TaxID=1742972 RepID=A0A0S4L4Q0_9BACT|nr:putative Hydrogenase nickel incorporation protein HypA [Candidatus Nitrospira nitrosa]